MNIYEKMAEVMKAVKYLSKDGNISYKTTQYKAITEEKVTSIVREKLIENGLVIFPIKQDHTKDGLLTTVDVTYRMVNIEKPGEFIDIVSSGTGADTQDKGVGKAMTYAYKYMLLRTFAIPTGEDPDKVSSDELSDIQRASEVRLATESQKEMIRSICKKHNINMEAMYMSNGTVEEKMTADEAGKYLATFKQKYGDD